MGAKPTSVQFKTGNPDAPRLRLGREVWGTFNTVEFTRYFLQIMDLLATSPQRTSGRVSGLSFAAA